MASLQKTYKREKLIGQIFTPDFIVEKILDDIGFRGELILGKKILDPACGDGQFLLKIAERIIAVSSPKKIAQNLEKIYGWDIDSEALSICIERLNALIAPLSISVQWNITLENALAKLPVRDIFNNKENVFFDFIVANPPYIRIQHLEKEQRQFIQNYYQFCRKGSTDIYIAFFELALQLLQPEHGIAGFITPNTFFYTETAAEMRQQFAQQQYLIQVTNYADLQIFDNASTYSAISIFSKQKKTTFLFQKALEKDCFEEKVLSQAILKQTPWRLSTQEQDQIQGTPLGEIAKIHVGITTLCDKVYIFKITETGNNFVIAHTKFFGDITIEKGILKPIIKGSTLKNSQQTIAEYVLFPYQKNDNNKHQIIAEETLQKKYPLAYQYLCKAKDLLDKRDDGKPNKVAWYAFGRSQGLDTSFGKKIIFSPMNKKPNFVRYENEECTFYSGYCIKYEGNLEELLLQLNSDRMHAFMQSGSRDFRGGWKAYNKKTVEQFIIV